MDFGLHKLEHLKRQKENGGKDRFSKLPEALVSQILSLLPTKDAIRTSVLSKRWIHRWKTITKLYFDDSVFYSRRKNKSGDQHFVNFVFGALLLTKSSVLDSFTLVIGNKYDVSLVNIWTSSVLNKGLKKLCIHPKMVLPFSSLNSSSLFNSGLLEELELSVAAVTVPTSNVHLAHLKSLKWSGITLTLKCSNYSDVLSLSFPLLQKSEAINCTWVGKICVTFIVPRLESVFMKQEAWYPSCGPNDCPIKFAASNLIEFTYCGYISRNITLLDRSSVCNANANIILSQWQADKAVLLLKQFSQVKHLKFEGCEVLAQSRVALLPAFGMLNHLELGLVGLEVLLGLLLKSPVLLKTLILKGLVSRIDQNFLNPAFVPKCLQHTLEVVKFGEVKGHDHELCLAKFVMQNGLVLKRMSFIIAAPIGKSKAIEEFKEKLFSFKKGFSFAIVEFSYN